LGEEERLWLTVQMIEALRNISADAQVGILIDRPWGDCSSNEHASSPFSFADTVVRMSGSVAFLVLEVIMGCGATGSYCRSLLSFSELLEQYREMGVPLRVRLGFPSRTPLDGGGGQWHAPASEATQAEWARCFCSTALAEPFVEMVSWAQFQDRIESDALPLGLISSEGNPKSAWDQIKRLSGMNRRDPRSTSA
jgi:hypothetical protein